MEITIGAYKLTPYTQGRGWNVLKWTEGGENPATKQQGKPRYKHTGYYGHDLGHALEIVYEESMREGVDTVDLRAAVTTAKRLQRELMGACATCTRCGA